MTKQADTRDRVLDLIERLSVGDAIPSERQLSADLGVSRLTVRAALDELVREVDVEWGRMMGERPHFEREGSAPHPDDPYTVGTVRNALDEALRELGNQQAG